MSLYRIEVIEIDAPDTGDERLAGRLREAGLPELGAVHASRLFFVESPADTPLDVATMRAIAADLLVDPIVERFELLSAGQEVRQPPGTTCVEVHPQPGVMDPVAESVLAELRAAGRPVQSVRTARRYVLDGAFAAERVRQTVARVLANECIEEVVVGTLGLRSAPQPPLREFRVRHVALRTLNEAGLERLSREGHLFLSLDEMRKVRAHFDVLGRDPTDLELETIAQTWSEHCVHKTLKSAVVYRGAAMPNGTDGGQAVPPGRRPEGEAAEVELRYANLLRDTIVRATDTVVAAGRGPRCLSVFKDNAGIIEFDDEYGVAFKVETHNHPSAIEPYGGAATGVGGCVRDVIGCGLGARPIANTDVFCVAPSDWPADAVPRGVLHPWRVLRGVVSGVADYGNRLGIPTVNGAIWFDPRYLGNPLVFCGCVGLIPRDKVEKAARPGDHIVLIGGRTGRDGIHGATFSSAELSDTHADEFSHAVQIGNAITEKRVLDAVLAARDDERGCLFSAITDCGAGGLSSAVGEMGEHTGAVVDLERVPLKYAGLRYDEIWISEAQERMVLAVPPSNLDRFLEITRQEECEATVIGTFGDEPGRGGEPLRGGPRLIVRYAGEVVGDLDMLFLHHGLPRREREARWEPKPPPTPPPASPATAILERLCAQLSRPNAASKAWVIRQYDHEVQGGSVVKPLGGPGDGPNDAAVLRPRLDRTRGIAVACGLAPDLSDVDPYWMALNAVDEALRNVVAVGGDPRRTAVLDNFCWGRVDEARSLGGLVRACQGCHDAGVAYGVPFISGKDSLNNEFALDAADVEPLLTTIGRYLGADDESRRAWGETAERIRGAGRLSIPGTLLVSALGIVEDVRRCVTADLKRGGHALLLVGGLPRVGLDLHAALAVHQAVADAIAAGLLRACHDVSDGGWLMCAAEMAIGGARGFDASAGLLAAPDAFSPSAAAYVVECSEPETLRSRLDRAGVRHVLLGQVRDEGACSFGDERADVAALRRAWSVEAGDGRL